MGQIDSCQQFVGVPPPAPTQRFLYLNDHRSFSSNIHKPHESNFTVIIVRPVVAGVGAFIGVDWVFDRAGRARAESSRLVWNAFAIY